jgi:hypothetical protein
VKPKVEPPVAEVHTKPLVEEAPADSRLEVSDVAVGGEKAAPECPSEPQISPSSFERNGTGGEEVREPPTLLKITPGARAVELRVQGPYIAADAGSKVRTPGTPQPVVVLRDHEVQAYVARDARAGWVGGAVIGDRMVEGGVAVERGGIIADRDLVVAEVHGDAALDSVRRAEAKIAGEVDLAAAAGLPARSDRQVAARRGPPVSDHRHDRERPRPGRSFGGRGFKGQGTGLSSHDRAGDQYAEQPSNSGLHDSVLL